MAVEAISWPSEFPELKKLDILLKCGICYDYMSTSMMTSCCHNYCSLCIRKFMQYKTQCPTCFEETYESGLRNNRPLDELIILYTKIRDKLLHSIRLAAVVKDEKQPEVSTPAPEKPEPSTTPKQTPKSKKKNFFSPRTAAATSSTPTSSKAAPDPPAEASPVPSTSKVPKMFISSPKKNQKTGKQVAMTSCPVCSVDIPARNINIHLDACLATVEGRAKPKAEKPPPKRETLPKRLYHLMADKDLKKHCKDFGLNPQGDRRTLVSRLQKFTVLYNSENDSAKPRPKSQLVLQIEREEREEKKHNTLATSYKPRIFFSRNTYSEDVEKMNKNYIKENKSSFKQLIENMCQREGRAIRPSKHGRRIESDDDTPGPSTSTEDQPEPEINTAQSDPETTKTTSPVRPRRNKRLFPVKIKKREIESTIYNSEDPPDDDEGTGPTHLEESMYQTIFPEDSDDEFETVFNSSFCMRDEPSGSTPLILAKRINRAKLREHQSSSQEGYDGPEEIPIYGTPPPENSSQELRGFETSQSNEEDHDERDEDDEEANDSRPRRSKRKAVPKQHADEEPRRSQRKRSKTSS